MSGVLRESSDTDIRQSSAGGLMLRSVLTWRPPFAYPHREPATVYSWVSKVRPLLPLWQPQHKGCINPRWDTYKDSINNPRPALFRCEGGLSALGSSLRPDGVRRMDAEKTCPRSEISMESL